MDAFDIQAFFFPHENSRPGNSYINHTYYLSDYFVYLKDLKYEWGTNGGTNQFALSFPSFYKDCDLYTEKYSIEITDNGVLEPKEFVVLGR